jgi:argininosuccinate lyase
LTVATEMTAVTRRPPCHGSGGGPSRGKGLLADLSLKDLQGIHASITADVFDVLSVDASVASRTSFGGTAPPKVRKKIAWWLSRN